MELKFKKAIEAGCIISLTSCHCGGRFAWLIPTKRGSHIMYGCICHNDPPDLNNLKEACKVHELLLKTNPKEK